MNNIDEEKPEVVKSQGHLRPNTLICYRGGGYSGCYWEWNYCFISSDGVFHDVASSGYGAIKGAKELVDRYEDWLRRCRERQSGAEQSPDRFKNCLCHTDLSNEMEFFALGPVPDENHNPFEEFADRYPVSHVIGVAEWFAEHNYPYSFRPRCSCCGERFDAVDGHGDRLEGCGGVRVAYGEILCEACYTAGACACCGDFVGEANMAKDPEDPERRAASGYCKWCEHARNGGPDPAADEAD